MADCVLWTAGALHKGYARVSLDGERVMLHRRVYEDLHGTLSDEWDVHHVCGVRNCVNPDHLEAIRHGDHTRLHHPARTHCPQGHPMTPGNVYEYGEWRHCKICRVEIKRRYRAKKRAA